MTGTLLTLGHGYSAQALSARLLPQGWRVIGTTRTQEKAQALTQAGLDALIWPGTDLTTALAGASHILVSAAPSDMGDPFLEEFGAAFRGIRPNWVGYLSTTGVYGHHGGEWIDETAPLNPGTKRGANRVMAERQWQVAARESGWPLHIFRLAGIYGPGRGPFAKVRAGTARRIIKPGQVFSRIHVEDIAQILEASIETPRAGAIYNVCDDVPAPPQDVIGYAAELLEQPLPPDEPFAFAEKNMTPMAKSFYSESKRVSNALIKSELGVDLLYPDYKTGLRALLEEAG